MYNERLKYGEAYEVERLDFEIAAILGLGRGLIRAGFPGLL
jgi:hypothetical protein